MLPWELLGLVQGKGVFCYQGLAKKLPGGLHLHSFFLLPFKWGSSQGKDLHAPFARL